VGIRSEDSSANTSGWDTGMAKAVPRHACTRVNPPTSPQIDNVYTSSITVSWTGVSEAVGYHLVASTESDNPPVNIWSSSSTYGSGATSATAYEYLPLYPNTTYYSFVKSNGPTGSSAYAAAGSTITLALPVSNAQIYKRYATSVTLNWTAHEASPSSSTCKGYIVQASSTNFTDGTIYSTTSYSVTPSTLAVVNLEALTTYWFRVGSYNASYTINYVSVGSTVTLESIAPAAITTLSASSIDYSGGIMLQWESPGDDNWTGTLGTESDQAQYRIQYETFTTVSWSTTTYDISIDTYGVTPHEVQTTITNLSMETTYYFRIWTRDEASAGNWSDVSSGATVWCRISPAAITTLSGIAELDGNVTLSWSAPGDDDWTGNISNGQYRIKWTTRTVVDWTSSFGSDYSNHYQLEFATATSSGNPETRVVTGLSGGVTYYFHIWTRDEDTGANNPGNWSSISNGSTVTITEVLSISLSTDTYNFGEIAVNTSSNAVTGITITNDGNVTQVYSVVVDSVTLSDNRPSVWKSTNTATGVGHDRFILYGIFNTGRASLSDFDTNDVIQDTSQLSTSTRYRDDDGGDQSGASVPIGETRDMWLRIDMPTTVTTAAEENIKIRIDSAKQ
jgi:hypothetical protein